MREAEAEDMHNEQNEGWGEEKLEKKQRMENVIKKDEQ
jgi:hypothetical protein